MTDSMPNLVHPGANPAPLDPMAPSPASRYQPASSLSSPSSAQTARSPQSSPSPDPTRPAPVTSAKAALNALLAKQRSLPKSPLAPSARDIVNAAAKNSPTATKSAATLHHGSIQKSLESTRTSTSASALLRSADKSSQPRPVVRTSLKIGEAARPERQPVVLPQGSRMARAARQALPPQPLGASRRPTLNTHRALNSLTPSVSQSQRPGLAAPGVNPSSVSSLQLASDRPVASSGSSNSIPVSTSSTSAPSVPHRNPRQIRDPQMVGFRSKAAPRPSTPAPTTVSSNGISIQFGSNNSAASAPNRPSASTQNRSTIAVQSRSATLAQNHSTRPAGSNLRNTLAGRRFRPASKGHALTKPETIADSSYVMSAPPKLSAHPAPPSSPAPAPGDKSPIGQVLGRAVASGHGGAATNEYLAIKSQNTSNYSFSRHNPTPATPKSSPAPKKRSLANESPFIKSVTVEKRPLSGDTRPQPTTSSTLQLPNPNASAKPTKSSKLSRKNTYTKKSAPAPASHSSLPSKPTVIIPSSRRSKAPLFFLVLLTIILGAAVGAAAYLCFFQ